MCRVLPPGPEARVIRDQVLRSATSVAANYRAACRARSKPEFLSKLTIALEEADETLFWLEMFADTDLLPRQRLALLMEEAEQLVRIFSAADRTTRSKIRNPKSQIPDRPE